MSTALHLAFFEIWRNRGRFLLFSLVIALITILVLFIAALGEGLGAGNREYIEQLDGDLIAFKDTARISIPASRLDRSKLRAIRNTDGVSEVGSVAFGSASIPRGLGLGLFDISLIGIHWFAAGRWMAWRRNTRIDTRMKWVHSSVMNTNLWHVLP